LSSSAPIDKRTDISAVVSLLIQFFNICSELQVTIASSNVES